MHPLERDLLGGCRSVKVAHDAFGDGGTRTDDPERRTTAPHLHTEARLDQMQILIEGPAEICQAGIVGGLQFEFTHSSGNGV